MFIICPDNNLSDLNTSLSKKANITYSGTFVSTAIITPSEFPIILVVMYSSYIEILFSRVGTGLSSIYGNETGLDYSVDNGVFTISRQNGGTFTVLGISLGTFTLTSG